MIFANPIESPLTIISQIQVANCLGETLNNLLHGSSIVRTVSQDNVNVIVVQSLEGALQALDNVLLGETTSVGLLATSTKEDLGRNNVLVSGVSELVQSTSVNARLVFASSYHYVLLRASREIHAVRHRYCLPHLNLRLAVGVDLGSVEKVATYVKISMLLPNAVLNHIPWSKAFWMHSLTTSPF